MAKAGSIVIDISAGTAQFLVDMDRSNAKLQEFGRGARESGLHVVSSMQASSAAIRLLENPMNLNIRAVERFLTLIPGIGPAMQAAFPIVGALALVNALGQMIDRAIDLKGSLEDLKRATADLNAEDEKLNSTVDSTAVEKLTEVFGVPAGLKQKANQEAAAAQDALLKAKNLRNEAKLLADNFNKTALLTDAIPIKGADIRRANQAQIDAKNAEATKAEEQAQALAAKADKSRFDMERNSVKDAAGLSVDRINNQIKANADIATLARSTAEIQIAAEHDVRQAKIDEIRDSLTRELAAASERVRVALATRDALNKINHDETQQHIALIQQKAAAESLGKTPVQAQGIQIKAQGEIAGLNAARYQNETKLQGDFIKAEGAYTEAVATMQRDLSEEVIKEGERRIAALNKEVDAMLADAAKVREQEQRIAEINAKGAGETESLKIEGQKINLERVYSAQLSHTAAQQIAQAQAVAQIDAQGRAAKIAQLEIEERIAQHDFGNEEHLVKAAQIQQEINKLKAEDANATAAADAAHQAALDAANTALQAQRTLAQAIADWNHINIGNIAQDVVDMIVRLPAQIANSLVDSIFNRPRRGQSKGQEILGGLEKTGEGALKTLLSIALTQGLERLLGGLFKNAAQAAQLAATKANTTALGDLTRALEKSGNPAAGPAPGTAAAGSSSSCCPDTNDALKQLGRLSSSQLGEQKKIADIAVASLSLQALMVAWQIALFLKPSILGTTFAEGGPVTHDQIAKVHGGEHVLNRDQVSGKAPLPGFVAARFPSTRDYMRVGSGSGAAAAHSSSSYSHSLSIGDMHVHGVQNTRELALEMVREMPEILKSFSYRWSGANS